MYNVVMRVLLNDTLASIMTGFSFCCTMMKLHLSESCSFSQYHQEQPLLHRFAGFWMAVLKVFYSAEIASS